VSLQCRVSIRASPFPAELVTALERLPGLRNVIMHEYVELDLERVVTALNELDPIERFVEIVAKLEEQA
jgi:uncharacterized protein YutE (UPF0331/DUF86 family)